MIANNLCEKNQQHDPIVKEIVQVSPADCPHYGSAPRLLPHICNRAKMQSGELLRNEFFTMSTLPPTINRHFSCPHKVDLVANDDDCLGVERARLPKTLQQPEWDKVWSRLSSHLQPFFWLIAHILTIFDKKYRILTRRDKRESYLIVLQQNNV